MGRLLASEANRPGLITRAGPHRFWTRKEAPVIVIGVTVMSVLIITVTITVRVDRRRRRKK